MCHGHRWIDGYGSSNIEGVKGMIYIYMYYILRCKINNGYFMVGYVLFNMGYIYAGTNPFGLCQINALCLE